MLLTLTLSSPTKLKVTELLLTSAFQNGSVPEHDNSFALIFEILNRITRDAKNFIFTSLYYSLS
jgi:hypothetical protein